jgi:hypothetical protein
MEWICSHLGLIVCALYVAFVFSVGVACTAKLLKRHSLGTVEIIIIGGGIGFVGVHGLLFGAMLFFPFEIALVGIVAAAGGIFLHSLYQMLRDGDFHHLLSGTFRGNEAVAERVMDSNELGRERGITILAKFVRKQFRREGTIFNPKSALACLALLGLLAWYANVYTNTFVYANGTYSGAIAGFGDVPFHLTQISRFAVGDHISLDDPTYAGAPLKYPFLINFMSAVLLRLGAPLVVAYHIPGLFFGVGSILLLYFVFKRLSGRRDLAYGGTILTLFASNTRYLLLAKDKFFATWHGLGGTLMYLGHLPFSVAHVWDATFPNQNVDSTALLPLFLLHQRSSIMGFWTMLAVVLLSLAYVASDAQSFTRLETLPLGILLAFFPLLHTHGFVALCIAASVWVGLVLMRKDQRLQSFLYSLLWTVPFILWQLAFLLGPNDAYTFTPLWRLGWMTTAGEIGGIRPDPSGIEPLPLTWLRFMWQNFGFILPAGGIAIAAAWRLRKEINAEHFWFFVPGSTLIFIVANTVKFQAWDFDTNKLFAFDVFFAVAVMMLVFSPLVSTWPKPALGIFSALLIISVPTGFLDVYARTTLLTPSTPGIFDADRVSLGRWVASATPENAVFTSSDDHLNPVNTLGGRRVVLGFKGWMWTHGISFGERERLISDFLNDPRGKAGTFRVLGPVYVLLDPKWRQEQPQLEAKLIAAFGQPNFSAGQFAVWKIAQ